jgi:alpha-galactosidase
MILYIKTNEIATDIDLSLLDSCRQLNENLTILIKKEIATDYFRISITLIPKNRVTLQSAVILDDIDSSINVNSVLLNGYQSWTDTREFRPDEKLPGQNPFLKPLLNNHFKLKYGSDYLFYKYKNKKGVLHGFSWSYIRDNTENVNFIGSLSENTGFTIIEYDFNKRKVHYIKDCSGRTLTAPYLAFDLIFSKETEEKCFENYFACMGIAKKQEENIHGWTSWYNYFTSISQSILYDNLESFAKNNIMLDYFQIDDGYQKHVGDWLQTNEKFPDGMKVLAEKIHEKGYNAGLWIAPFICEGLSDIYINHKDWLLKDNNKPVPAGRNPNWSGDFFALDFYNSEFQEYLKTVFKTILEDWNYDLVKIDFLYAACIVPGYDKTRGEIMSDAMNFIRNITCNKKILACGVPLCSAFGKVDFCRIGPDVGLTWENKKAKFIRHRERISTINAIKSTIYRRCLNGYGFFNDPDVFILRNNNNRLNFDERFTLFMINFLFSNVMFTSDKVDEFCEKEKEVFLWLLSIRTKVIDEIILSDDFLTVTFHTNQKKYLLISNLKSTAAEIKMKNQYRHTFSFNQQNKKLLPYHTSVLMHVKL